MVRETKLYDLLGVQPGATDSELKKAYRKVSLPGPRRSPRLWAGPGAQRFTSPWTELWCPHSDKIPPLHGHAQPTRLQARVAKE